MLRQEVSAWKDFHTYWINHASDPRKVPVFFFRYEDITTDPVSTLIELFKYLLEVPSLEGTWLEKRINQVTAADSILYKPRSTSKVNTQFNETQQKHVHDTLEDQLCFFGYLP